MKQLKQTKLNIFELNATITYTHTSVSPMLEASSIKEGHTILSTPGTTVKKQTKMSRETAL